MAVGTPRFQIRLEYDQRSLDRFRTEIEGSLEVIAREGAQEFLLAMEDRIASQDIPGPPLSEVTVEIESRVLAKAGGNASNASKKWLFFDRAVSESFITTERLAASAKADIRLPEGRTLAQMRALERGGINEQGKAIPARPLATTVADRDLGRVANRAREVLNRILSGMG